MVDFSPLDTARNTAQTTAQTALDYGTRGFTLADELRKAVGERFAESPIAQQGAEARANFLSAAPQARSDVAGLVSGGAIMSPSQQAAIIAAKRGSALVPVMGANTLQEAAFGTMKDLIDAGTNAWNSQSTYQTGLADLASKNYSTLLDELFKKSQEERAAEMQPYDIAYKQALINNAGGGGSTSKQLTTIGNKVYNYNSKTGTLEQIQGVNPSKYDETDVANFANGIADGSMKIVNVPQEIRGEVQTLADQILASKPNILQQIGNMFSGLFNQ